MIEAAKLEADIYPAGPRGLSAYEIYKKEGGQLSEEEWLKSLNGLTPTIGENGNWFLGTVDTGLPSRGPKGDTGSIKFIVVTELPTENIDETAIYLKPVESPTGENKFEELIYVNGKWEDLGTPNVAVDLSNYYTKEEIGALTDLSTEDKSSLVNAINEVNSKGLDFTGYNIYYAKPKDGEDFIAINDLPSYKYDTDIEQKKKLNIIPTNIKIVLRLEDGSIKYLAGSPDLNSSTNINGFRAITIEYIGDDILTATNIYITSLIFSEDSGPSLYRSIFKVNSAMLSSPGQAFINGNIVTRPQTDYWYSKKADVLTKTNTTSYTPTADYHPATKKYVDDTISAKGGDKLHDYNIYTITLDDYNLKGTFPTITDTTTLAKFDEILTDIYKKRISANATHDNAFLIVYSKADTFIFRTNTIQASYCYLYGTYIEEPIDTNGHTRSYQFYITGTLDTTAQTFKTTKVKFDRNSKRVLLTNNTLSYTPTGDYNPSTKLYTDKTHYEKMTGYDATKTQVLKNINGTLTWVDEV